MNGALLADTGYLIALWGERDKHHEMAQCNKRLLDLHPVVLPWPVLYETIKTRFARRPNVLTLMDAIIAKADTLLLNDSPYREGACRQVRQTSRKRPPSLVDAVLRPVIEDENVRISGLSTFNAKDFHDLCCPRHVDLPRRNARTT